MKQKIHTGIAMLMLALLPQFASANLLIIRVNPDKSISYERIVRSVERVQVSTTMEACAIGDTFNVGPTGAPMPYPQFDFMHYYRVSTGVNPTAFAGLKLTLAGDTLDPASFIEYTIATGVQIYPTDDSLLIQMGVLDECTLYSFGVDMYYDVDTVKSTFSQIRIMDCTTPVITVDNSSNNKKELFAIYDIQGKLLGKNRTHLPVGIYCMVYKYQDGRIVTTKEFIKKE